METRFYIDGKCILSYDDDVFSSDEDRNNIRELLIDPLVDKAYEKHYQEQLVLPILEKTLKKNDTIYKAYCDIKSLINDEIISVEYMQEDNDTLLKRLMRDKLNSDEYTVFEELLGEASSDAFKEEMNFLSSGELMIEHYWKEIGIEKRKYPI